MKKDKDCAKIKLCRNHKSDNYGVYEFIMVFFTMEIKRRLYYFNKNTICIFMHQ